MKHSLTSMRQMLAAECPSIPGGGLLRIWVRQAPFMVLTLAVLALAWLA